MIRFQPLPPLALTDLQPSFYDVESVSTVEMVSKLYGYLQNLVDNYNSFATEVNNEITNFENSTDKNICDFKKCVMDLMSNFIESIDTKIDLQNTTISEAVDYMKINLQNSLHDLLMELIESGNLYISMDYDSENEELTFTLTEGGNINE